MGVFTDIEAVLFDLGGTLIDYPLPSVPVMAGRCIQGVYRFLVGPEDRLAPPATSVPGPDEAQARRRAASPDSPLPHRLMTALRRMVRSVSGRTLPRIGEACARPLVAGGRLFDDALPTVRALVDRGYRLGCVSNTPWGTPDYLWTGQLERFALAPLFEVCLFSSDIGFRKPDARIFRAALNRLGVAPDRSVFVGDDAEADIAGARGVGVHTVHVVRPDRARSGPDPGPDLRVETLVELLDHLPPRAKKG
jgi:FMN phosphatase YigB (HAD superfamily)